MTTLYSIGYGKRSWEEFQQLILKRDCKFLIDVRSSPYSRFNPSFSQDSLTNLCNGVDVRYVFMGDTLGGRPISDEHYDNEGKVDYKILGASDSFKNGLSRLVTAHDKGIRVCVMCSEIKPEDCHRCKLIGVELKLLGIELIHIDENGLDTSQDDVLKRLTGGQDDMFGEVPELTRSRGVYKK